MSAGVTIDARILYDRFPALAVALQRKAEAAVAKVAHDVLADAVERAPHDTGNLKGSGSAAKVGPATWRVGFAADYAAFQEFGTSRMAAQPFLVPAWHAGRPKLIAALRSLP